MKQITFRIRKIASHGQMRVIVVPKKYHHNFLKLGENRAFDILCKPLPELEGPEK